MKLFSLFTWIFPVHLYQTNVGAAVIGSAVVGGVMGADAQKDAARTSSDAQVASTQLGIAEQRRQFDAIQSLLKPYTDAGSGAVTAYQDLLGVNGFGKQGAAIDNIVYVDPTYESLVNQGEEAIRQNASATGGLRGGNTQAALAQFRPQLLSQLINERFGKLSGLASLGQNAAAGVGNAGMQTGNAISGLLQQQGAAQAGAALAAGKAQADMWAAPSKAIGMYAGMGGIKF